MPSHSQPATSFVPSNDEAKEFQEFLIVAVFSIQTCPELAEVKMPLVLPVWPNTTSFVPSDDDASEYQYAFVTCALVCNIHVWPEFAEV